MKVGSHNYLIPAAGMLVKALKFCTGKKPIITGKPNPFSLNLISEK